MSNGSHNEDRPGPIRASRFELVDPQNRIRGVVGDVSGETEQYAPGVALLDVDGRTRVWLGAFEHGVLLSFNRGGNVVLELGVAEGDAHIPGPYLVLCDPDGATVLSWRLDTDGRPITEEPM